MLGCEEGAATQVSGRERSPATSVDPPVSSPSHATVLLRRSVDHERNRRARFPRPSSRPDGDSGEAQPGDLPPIGREANTPLTAVPVGSKPSGLAGTAWLAAYSGDVHEPGGIVRGAEKEQPEPAEGRPPLARRPPRSRGGSSGDHRSSRFHRARVRGIVATLPDQPIGRRASLRRPLTRARSKITSRTALPKPS